MLRLALMAGGRGLIGRACFRPAPGYGTPDAANRSCRAAGRGNKGDARDGGTNGVSPILFSGVNMLVHCIFVLATVILLFASWPA